ncbi:MAG: glycosyltransferase family 2 protein [Lachnospiraceae bacterium]|jgi:GT2 family glycosyltransferase|nr:glycosyltransferase family 2 protein [Lachnospiraceae bacterium]
MKYKIDVVRIRENSITLNGWVVGKTPQSKAAFRVLNQDKKPVKFRHVATRRDDVSQIYFKKTYDRDFGFDIQFPYERGHNYWLLIRCDGRVIRIKFNEELIARRASVAYKRMEKIRDLMNMETVRVALDFGKKHGIKALLLKSKHKIQGLDNDYDYKEWYDLTKPDEEELKRQKEEKLSVQPLLSIVIPAYKTPEKYLREMMDSILAQTYDNWEVCVANGSPEGEGKIVERVMSWYEKRDGRFHCQNLGENRGIAGNTNAALQMAKGDYIILADHDDTLPEYALYEVAAAIASHPECDMIYSDEDKLDMDGGALFDPHFKPDFNPDLLTSVNYICHLLTVKRALLEQVGGFRHEFDGAQDYDFIFRCSEAAKGIYHIPKVLYHWRCHQDSTASNPESKLYAFEAGSRAIMAHYERCGILADKVEKGVDYGIYHTTFRIKGEPLVSVVIPNKDHTEDLDLCIRSILAKATYKNLEFVVIENNSKAKETFAYYEEIQKEFPQVRVVYWEREFNYSAINNFGASQAKGEYLLFLNNDTELIEPRLIEELLGFCQREDVGAVGARLLYQDDTIQHAGVVVGFGGIAGHTFIGLHQAENSYFHRAMCAQDYSAVTAACMMTKAEVFSQAGGFTEELAVAFNDIDYCMKVRARGLLVVYAPYALMYHYESKSRGLEDTPEKVARFNREIRIFANRWPDILAKGDPYYNPNLTLRKSNFALRDLLKEKIGEPYKLDVEL